MLDSTRAPFACLYEESRGRRHPEQEHYGRTPFQCDRDRIIQSTAFRRLAHKTQVFVPHEGDHYRTRLTHTIEVAQIARSLARALRLDEDLTEALALAHDLGHTCFGHSGEDALARCMSACGGFDHNAQALRIVTRLEQRHAEFDGLNLTWETLEGLVKHNGPLQDAAGNPMPRYRASGIPPAILRHEAGYPLDIASYASLEAQVAAIADDIAYNAHDLDDGMRVGILDFDALRTVPFLRALIDGIGRRYPGLSSARLRHESVQTLRLRLMEDVINGTRQALEKKALEGAAIDHARAVRAHHGPLVGFTPAMAAAEKDIKSFLHTTLYRHPRVMAIRDQADAVVSALFTHLLAHPRDLPLGWADAAAALPDDTHRAGRHARLVGDYIAGMTDRYALSLHKQFFGTAPDMTFRACSAKS